MDPRQMFDQWAAGQGIIAKAEGGVIDTSGVNFGGIIPRPLVEELISLTRTQSTWLGAIDTRIRDRSSGYVPVVDWNEPVTEGVGENDGTKVTTKPPTTNVPFACKKFKSEYYITFEELREAVAAGIDNFEEKMTSDWATALGNDVANLAINGDKTLDSSSRTNRLLKMVDGLHKQTASGANVFDAEGKAFDQGIFAAMLDYMPDRFANDGGLQWLFNRRVDISWLNSLTNVNTTERMRSTLGDAALTSQNNVPPLGIQQLIVPQIARAGGPTPIAPTSAAASGNGIVFDLTTLITATYIATVALGVGRKFKVTCLATGLSETRPGVDDTQLKITTLGILGQEVVSTVAADYVVTLADETEMYLMNPNGLVLVYVGEWRSYREYNKDFDRYEITTYFEADVLVPLPDTIVRFTRVQIPAVTW